MKHITSNRERPAIAEAEATELGRLGDELLERTDGADSRTAAALRHETTRLFSRAFDITEALAHNDVARAYRLAVGGDVEDPSLGMAG